MKTLKICLVLLCLLPFRAVGLPQFDGANFFMKEIKLGRGNKVALIDDEDFEKVSKYKWHLTGALGRQYVVHSFTKNHKKQINLHRFIMNEPDGLVDHRNHDRLNCQKSNLRVCSFKDNIRNSRRMSRIGKSKYKGLTFNPKVKRWRAKVYADGKRYELGYFDKEVDAAIAYNNAVIKLHGEFACINIIE